MTQKGETRRLRKEFREKALKHIIEVLNSGKRKFSFDENFGRNIKEIKLIANPILCDLFGEANITVNALAEYRGIYEISISAEDLLLDYEYMVESIDKRISKFLDTRDEKYLNTLVITTNVKGSVGMSLIVPVLARELANKTGCIIKSNFNNNTREVTLGFTPTVDILKRRFKMGFFR